MHLEPFAFGHSPVHTLDPRIKILGLVPFIVLIAISNHIWTPVIALVPGLFLIVFARLNPGALFERVGAVNVFLLLLWLIFPFTIPGEPLFVLGFLRPSAEGIMQALRITAKANVIFLFTIALIGTVPLFQLAHAMRLLRIPEKLVMLFFFCYRYITVLHEDYHALHNAMKIRAFRPKTNTHTYASYAYLVGMLLLRSFHHSQRIYQAMLCRGFRDQFPVMHELRTSSKDYFFLVLMMMLSLFLIGVEVWTTIQ